MEYGHFFTYQYLQDQISRQNNKALLELKYFTSTHLKK